jgi:hypothetical protein
VLGCYVVMFKWGLEGFCICIGIESDVFVVSVDFDEGWMLFCCFVVCTIYLNK